MTALRHFQGRVIVVIPTYNERDNLRPITARVRRAMPHADLLIVDDNSPDGTGEIAAGLAAADHHIHVLHRPGKAGLGAAYVAGFDWALERQYDAIVEMDADGSHQPEELSRLLGALNDADLVLGSRWIPGGQVQNWPAHRYLLSRVGNGYTRLMLGVTLHDVTGGYRVYRASGLRQLELHTVDSQGYCFQVDLVRRAVHAGLHVVEVPITFVERTSGISKMKGAIVGEALWRVTRWGLADRRRKPSQTEVPPTSTAGWV